MSLLADKYASNKGDVTDKEQPKLSVNETDLYGYKPPIKILVLDIEKYMAEVLLKRLTWGQKVDIEFAKPHEITRHSSISMVSYKWLGETATYNINAFGDPDRFEKNPYDDYYICKQIGHTVDKADVVVAHNGKRFDIKEINARRAVHGLPILKNVIVLDTLSQAKKHFGQGLIGNSLNNLCRVLGLPIFKGKAPSFEEMTLNPSFELIMECAKYCNIDVDALAELTMYLMKVGALGGVYNINTILGTKDLCNTCGHSDTLGETKHGYQFTKSVRYKELECTWCNTRQKGERVK